jgi:cytochrome P450
VIDIDRKPRHITFGIGPHVCLGIHLAKREMRIMLEAFLSRMKNIRMPEGGRYEYHTTNTIGLDRLDLVWDPA